VVAHAWGANTTIQALLGCQCWDLDCSVGVVRQRLNLVCDESQLMDSRLVYARCQAYSGVVRMLCALLIGFTAMITRTSKVFRPIGKLSIWLRPFHYARIRFLVDSVPLSHPVPFAFTKVAWLGLICLRLVCSPLSAVDCRTSMGSHWSSTCLSYHMWTPSRLGSMLSSFCGDCIARTHLLAVSMR
jgi:hypothetical protein